MAKTTNVGNSPTTLKHKGKAQGNEGQGGRFILQVDEYGKFGKCSENDNFLQIVNKPQALVKSGPLQAGGFGKFGKSGENDNFSKLLTSCLHKATKEKWGPRKLANLANVAK